MIFCVFGLGSILRADLCVELVVTSFPFSVAVNAILLDGFGLDVPPSEASRGFTRNALFLWKPQASILGLGEPAPVLMSLAGSLSPSWRLELLAMAPYCGFFALG